MRNIYKLYPERKGHETELDNILVFIIRGRAKNRNQAFAFWMNSLFHFMSLLIQYNKSIASTF